MRNPWAQSILAAVTDADGKPFFANRPELLRATERKTAAPLFGVVFRLAASAADSACCWEIVADMAAPIFLSWAGAALRPEWGTTAAEYLAELRADPLGAIARPAGREPNNAGQFLRRSLARVVPTAEMPDLPAVAERLFAGLAAFHPSYGAPRSWWSMAHGHEA